jgi:hypothetical protein
MLTELHDITAAPKAGPTGGGFAAPPLTCSLTTSNFFSHFLNLTLQSLTL